jgi:hypothetical protein
MIEIRNDHRNKKSSQHGIIAQAIFRAATVGPSAADRQRRRLDPAVPVVLCVPGWKKACRLARVLHSRRAPLERRGFFPLVRSFDLA